MLFLLARSEWRAKQETDENFLSTLLSPFLHLCSFLSNGRRHPSLQGDRPVHRHRFQRMAERAEVAGPGGTDSAGIRSTGHGTRWEGRELRAGQARQGRACPLASRPPRSYTWGGGALTDATPAPTLPIPSPLLRKETRTGPQPPPA